jgi:hypothetical protein
MSNKQANPNSDGLPSDPLDPSAPQDAADAQEASAAAKAQITNSVTGTGTIRVTG